MIADLLGLRPRLTDVEVLLREHLCAEQFADFQKTGAWNLRGQDDLIYRVSTSGKCPTVRIGNYGRNVWARIFGASETQWRVSLAQHPIDHALALHLFIKWDTLAFTATGCHCGVPVYLREPGEPRNRPVDEYYVLSDYGGAI